MYSQILISYCWYQAVMVSCARECTAWLQRRLSHLGLLPIVPSGVVHFEIWRVLYASSIVCPFSGTRTKTIIYWITWSENIEHDGEVPAYQKELWQRQIYEDRKTAQNALWLFWGSVQRRQTEKRVVNSAWRNLRDFAEEMTLDPGLEGWVDIAQSE